MNNKRGFSLLETMIAIGLATAAFLYLFQMQGQQSRALKESKTKMEIDAFINEFRATLSRDGFCSQTLKGKRLNNNSEIIVSSVLNPLGSPRYSVDQILGDNTFKIKEFLINNFRADSKDGREGTASFVVKLEKMGKAVKDKTITRQFDIPIIRDEKNDVVQCGLVSFPDQGSEKPISNLQVSKENLEQMAKQVDLNSEEAKKIIESNPQLKEMQESLEKLKKLQAEQSKEEE